MRKIPVEFECPFDNYILDLAEKTAPTVYKLGMTPNMITTLSNIATIIVVILLFKAEWYWAAFFVLIAYFFDCLDGHLARSYNMITVFGDYYDHISDITKVIVVLTSLYIINPEKLTRVLPLLVVLMILSFVHLGCQELYYDEEDSPTLKFAKSLCPVPLNFTKDELESTIKNTRLFGVGTFWLSIIMIIIYYDY
jgi:phosphatidylglycerophosphate synthase